VFDLPAVCHYGIGGPGFGAWRELDVHATTTNWVLDGDCPSFPLMYHWRVLPRASPSLPDDLADVERVVEYWQGSPQVRRRVEAINDASASVVVFLEYFAQNLSEWFSTHLTDSACAMVERELAAGTSFMNARGLLHFDAHFENILTDGERLYFADFGLAMDPRFDLSAAESAFYRENLTYDRQYTTTYLVDWLVGAFHRFTRQERDDYIRGCAEGAPPAGMPHRAAAIVARHAPVAVVMNEFFRRLQDESRGTPYPGRIQV
jgi:serine/threonine protein kinase